MKDGIISRRQKTFEAKVLAQALSRLGDLQSASLVQFFRSLVVGDQGVPSQTTSTAKLTPVQGLQSK